MSPNEAAVLAAARELGRAVRAYNAYVDSHERLSKPEYTELAETMQRAEEGLIRAVDPLLEELDAEVQEEARRDRGDAV